jgi:hypothetical protein
MSGTGMPAVVGLLLACKRHGPAVATAGGGIGHGGVDASCGAATQRNSGIRSATLPVTSPSRRRTLPRFCSRSVISSLKTDELRTHVTTQGAEAAPQSSAFYTRFERSSPATKTGRRDRSHRRE